MTSTSPTPPMPTIATHLQPYQLPPSSFPEYFIETSNSVPSRSPSPTPTSSPTSNPNTSAQTKRRLVASAVVIHSNRVLLLQRAAHSFQPLLWELPGGRCEVYDESVIASAIRELREESGLVANRVTDIVGEYGWLDRGERWKKITFLMGVERDEDDCSDVVGNDVRQHPPPQVTIDPKEQASFIWATEEDVVADRCGGTALAWTSEDQKQTVLNAFKLVR